MFTNCWLRPPPGGLPAYKKSKPQAMASLDFGVLTDTDETSWLKLPSFHSYKYKATP